MTSVEQKKVHPCTRLCGRLSVPGDKSISHRLAMLTALADGTSTLENFLDSEDCLNTVAAMAALGAGVEQSGTTVQITGTRGAFIAPRDTIDLGNSGTGMRLLAGLLAGHPFTSELTGDASLRSRPMQRIRDPLERMGAQVELMGEGGCAPVRIHGGGLRGIRYALPVASAQVKSCTLLAGLFADGTTEVIEPKRTRDHTERLLQAMGAPIAVDGPCVSIRPEPSKRLHLRAGCWRVPGDFSSAAFWLTAAACRSGSSVTIANVGLNARRTALLDVLLRMGATLEVVRDPDGGGAEGWEATGSVTVTGGRLKGTVVEGEEIPNLIDELPLVAVAGALADGDTIIRDAAELRVKESDRIRTTAHALRAFGVDVDEFPDGLCIHGCGKLTGGGTVDSGGDHRIAMAGTILALCGERAAEIRDVACVQTSYPGFWDDVHKLGGTVDEG